jgi:O-antigen/teichoic acid export membrane protein
MDQGFFAVSSLVINVLLARWLPQRDYGAFVVAFSVVLLMGTVHTAVLGEPMHVFGPSRYRDRAGAYIRQLIPLHFILTIGMSSILLLVLGVLSLFNRPLATTSTLAAVAISAPGILFLWLMRRACYIESRPRLAAAAGLVFVLLIPAGLLVMTNATTLTAATGLVIVGVASLLVGGGLWRQLTGRRSAATVPIPISDITRSHWSYGRWAVGSGLLAWVPGNAVVVALPLWHTLDDAATFRVATMLMLPVQNVQTALAALILPALVRARLSGRLRASARLARLLFLGLSILYAPIVVVFGSQITQLLFGAQYRIHGATLWLLAAIPLATAASVVSGTVLRALERPDRVLWTYVAATAVTCLIGLPLVAGFGVDGALTALLLSAATTAILGTWADRRLIGTGPTHGAAPPVRTDSSDRPSRGRYGSYRSNHRDAGTLGVGTGQMPASPSDPVA